MSTYDPSHNGTFRGSASYRKLLSTSALVAVGFVGLSAMPALADSSWGALTTDSGAFGTAVSGDLKTTTITLSTARAIASGDADIFAGDTVNVNGSLFVVRDNKASPTQILGSLNSNGEIIIIDDNGVFFGKDSVVDVAGIIATTGAIGNADILDGDGNYTITALGAGTMIEMKGQIDIDGAGLAAFVAPTVKNSGVINAKMGTVAFAAGQTVTLDMYGDGLFEVAVVGELADALLHNKAAGEINAESGRVLMSAAAAKGVTDNIINVNGIVTVASATVKGGKIILDGGAKGTVRVNGSVDASGTAGAEGGSIEVAGQRVNVEAAGELEAAGDQAKITVTTDALRLKGSLEAVDGSVLLTRQTLGNIDLGASQGSTLRISQAELDRVKASRLDFGQFFGFDHQVNVRNVNASALSQVVLRTNRTGGALDENVIFKGANIFDNLVVDAGDSIIFAKNTDVLTTGSVDVTTSTHGVNTFVMEKNSTLLSDGFFIAIDTGDISLAGGASISKYPNGFIAIRNTGTFSSVDADSIRSTGSGTISIRQNTGGSIQNAIDAVLNTGTGQNTLYTDDGVFVEDLDINQANLKIDGDGTTIVGTMTVAASNFHLDPVIVDAGGADYGLVATGVGADGLIVDENTFKNAAKAGIYIDRDSASSAMIKNNIFKNSVKTAVEIGFLAGGFILDILDNDIKASGDGISATAGLGNDVTLNIKRNSIVAGGHGINISGVNLKDRVRITIEENTKIKAKGGHGILIDDPQSGGVWLSILNNENISASQSGIYVKRFVTPKIIGNTIHDTGEDGIYFWFGAGAQIKDNKIGLSGGAGNIGGNGISVNYFANRAIIDNNEIRNAVGHGIVSEDSNQLTVTNNKIKKVGGHGIFVTDKTDHDISHNRIRRAGLDGIHIEDFGSAWIAYNNIKWTGDDGIEAVNGDFVSIYDNYIQLAGFAPLAHPGPFGPFNEVTDIDEDHGADGIHVRDVYGSEVLVLAKPGDAPDGFGHSSYGASVEIYGNDVSLIDDDGVQVEDSASTYIGNNIIGHVGDDGVDVDDVDVIKVSNNIITLAADKGITIDGGTYAGVFDNRILLTGSHGIQIENIHGGGADILTLGDSGYGYGWAVNVSGNEVAMTGGHGIEVKNDFDDRIGSGPVKIFDNDVFMAGMGRGLRGLISTVNGFASGTASFGPPIPVVTRLLALDVEEEVYDLPSFDWYWGNDHGISVENVYGAYDSPNGWAVDIRKNNVKWTGGHGINVENADRTRIKRNHVKQAGVDYTYMTGFDSLLDVISHGPFDSEGRRDLWRSEGELMIADVLESYFGREEPLPEPSPEPDYVTISEVGYDSYDGIHAEHIYSDSPRGLFALKIKGNDVRVTGDDGIEVVYADRTLIQNNVIRDAGHGSDEDYGSGDYYGADGIHARYITADLRPRKKREPLPLSAAGILDGEPTDEEHGPYYEPDSNYALIVRDNNIRRTADDGIEVVGDREDAHDSGAAFRSIFGQTDRVLIAENKVRNAGLGYDYAGDYYGADGIHVRGINGGNSFAPMLTGTGGFGGRFYGYAVDIIDNKVRRTRDHGISVFDSESTLVAYNDVKRAGILNHSFDEKRSFKGSYGVDADGIHIEDVGSFGEGSFPPWALSRSAGLSGGGDIGYGFEPYAAVVYDNVINKSADDGVEVLYTGRTRIEWNQINDSGFRARRPSRGLTLDSRFEDEWSEGWNSADGIHVDFVRGFDDFFPGTALLEGPGILGGGVIGPMPSFGFDVEIVDNIIHDSAGNGVSVGAHSTGPFSYSPPLNVLIDDNKIYDSGVNGILLLAGGGHPLMDVSPGLGRTLLSPYPGLSMVGRGMNSLIDGNLVERSGSNGLFVQGAEHHNVLVSDNVFTDNPIGAHFESGLIDISDLEEPNTFNGGRIGYRFAPAVAGYGYPSEDGPSEGTDRVLTRLASTPFFAEMALVDDTLGGSIFNGQDSFYVQLANGAFFNPGTPTIINGLNAVFDGFSPVSQAGVLTQGQLDAIEDKLFDFDDDTTLGQIFVGGVPDAAGATLENIQDFFSEFGGFGPGTSGLNVTVTGLPSIGGANVVVQGNVANIEPAAGGEGEEDLAAIEPAAGDEGEDTKTVSCWSDAIGAAGDGVSVTYSFGTGLADALAGAAGCGSESI